MLPERVDRIADGGAIRGGDVVAVVILTGYKLSKCCVVVVIWKDDGKCGEHA